MHFILNRAEEKQRQQEQQQAAGASTSYAPRSNVARAMNTQHRIQSLLQLPKSVPEQDLQESYAALAAEAVENRREANRAKKKKEDQPCQQQQLS